ncbi:L-aspartate oxidase [Bacillus sp. H-16]|uniref:L-aspartate oxidase n=1 Tax=Alteribacter salitolerans TaxID=2912333 RepID=UPI00196595CB|nr:L-aspartate oxidase [Alteribacter salitolerans]MBM7097390.1 L-aspartate oxidase [Alteribacter salitolerans]
MRKLNVIILGSGLAALTAARELSVNCNVIIFTKTGRASSWKAQGGIAAAVNEDDVKHHAADTLYAGAGHGNERAVKTLVQDGVRAVHEWIKEGMSFDKDLNGDFARCLEGAHSVRRILHAGGDQTGKRMMEHILSTCLTIDLFTDKKVVDLIINEGSCRGVTVKGRNGGIEHVFADAVVIATGGYGGLFDSSSADKSLAGEGSALAYRGGAELEDMEFTQFHPTLLWSENKSHGLISEAVRGEGAVLVNGKNERLMAWHPLKDLAPRDVVARTLYENVKKGIPVFLDIQCVTDMEKRFPTVSAICKRAGVDLYKGKIPVRPGAHFSIGGVRTDINGCTSVEGLYAAGEAACTGVHGANRLASNSLLETIVFGKRTASHIAATVRPRNINTSATRRADIKPLKFPEKEAVIKAVSHGAGIEKNPDDLKELIGFCETFQVKQHLHSLRENWKLKEVEVSNMLITAWLIATSSLIRTESRGSHYRSDCPVQNPEQWEGKKVIRHISEKLIRPCFTEGSTEYEPMDTETNA